MLIGDVLVGRWVPPAARDRLINPLHALLAAPYAIFLLKPGAWLAAAAVLVASVGYAAGLGLQQRLLDATPGALRNQALGLDGSARMSMQAVSAAAVGGVAELIGAAGAMTAAAVASLLITAALWPRLRHPVKAGAIDATHSRASASR